MKIIYFCLLIFTASVVQGTNYEVTDQVYFDIKYNEESFGRITIGLFGNVVPKTVKNFKLIASDGINGYSYKGTKFHRVISKFMIQGGDILMNNGSGSLSIYGKHFDDENFDIKHVGSGFISMANSGKNTNGCQFFITTVSTPWLDGQHTVFGKLCCFTTADLSELFKRIAIAELALKYLYDVKFEYTVIIARPININSKLVIDGLDIVHKIERVRTDIDNRPITDIIIAQSGIIDTSKSFIVSDNAYEFWAWIDAAMIPLGMSFSILGLFHWMIRKLNI